MPRGPASFLGLLRRPLPAPFRRSRDCHTLCRTYPTARANFEQKRGGAKNRRRSKSVNLPVAFIRALPVTRAEIAVRVRLHEVRGWFARTSFGFRTPPIFSHFWKVLLRPRSYFGLLRRSLST